jgi:hypothetical protein
MIYEDIAAAIVVALFIWLVPVRRNGIPGLRGRGKLPPGPPPTDLGDAAPRAGDETAGGPLPGDRSGGAERVLADLDASWEPGYADRVTAEHKSRRKPA